MKGYALFCAWLGLLPFSSPAPAQGTFQSLDFEQAKIIITPSGFISTTNAFPGWEVFGNGVAMDQVQRDAVLFLGAGIDDGSDGLGLAPLDGKFSAALAGTGLIGVTMSLAQSGVIISGSESLRFLALGGFSVFFAGHAIPVQPLGSGPNFSEVYGADISPYAGQYGQLLFQIGPSSSVGVNLLDDISFSPFPLPEPRVLAIAALGALVLGWRLWRKRMGDRHAGAGPR